MDGYGPIGDLIAPYLKRVKCGTKNMTGCCPLHKDRDPSFSINIHTGLWICGGCKERGNLPTLLKKLGQSSRAIDISLEPIKSQLKKETKRRLRKRRDAFWKKDPYMGEFILKESVLGVYHYCPNDLVHKGFDRDLLFDLGIGYDLEKDRIIFPIRDLYGNLVGVSGRATRSGDQPRYKIYKRSSKDVIGDFGEEFDRQYPGYDITGRRYIWNADRAYAGILHDEDGSDDLIIVEGFKACIWMIQNGWENTVCLMGSNLSMEQYLVIGVLARRTITLLFDNDPAGRKASKEVGDRIRRLGHVYVADLPEWAHQPDDLNELGLKEIIDRKERHHIWKRTIRLEEAELVAR